MPFETLLYSYTYILVLSRRAAIVPRYREISHPEINRNESFQAVERKEPNASAGKAKLGRYGKDDSKD